MDILQAFQVAAGACFGWVFVCIVASFANRNAGLKIASMSAFIGAVVTYSLVVGG